jgi:hypothetical protein
VSVGAHVIVALLIEIDASAAAVTPTANGALEVAASAGMIATPSASVHDATTAIRYFIMSFSLRKSFESSLKTAEWATR